MTYSRTQAVAQTWALVLILCAAMPSYAFKIVEPAEGSTVESGGTVTARVDVGSDTGIVKVRYYWYPEAADTLVEQDEERSGKSSQDRLADEKYWQRDSVTDAPVVALPSLVSTSDGRPPFGGALKVPAGAIGEQVTVTATIVAVDKAAGTVTIKGPGGDTEVVKARDPKNLELVKVGDLVELTYTRALVIALDKAPK